MSRTRALLPVGVLALGAALVAPALNGPSPAPSDDVRTVSEQRPTNAAKIYRWGNAAWSDDFVGPVKRGKWKLNGDIRNQHGMLTINGGSRAKDVTATVTDHARSYGRWESRVRAQQYSSRYTPYKVVAELIPAGSSYSCGAKNLVTARYPLGSNVARMAVRTKPNNRFVASKKLDLRPGPFHTYAVEVTKTHISWFVDTKVQRTERRPAALSGTTFKVRFRLEATPGKRMNPGRMQMDWARYYTLERKNAKSIAAPQLSRRTYRSGC